MTRAVSHPDLLPSVAIVAGGVFWGLFWIPVRAVGAYGLEGAWAGVVIYAGALLALSPLVVIRWRSLARNFGPLAWCGLFTGAAFSLYLTSLFLTDVVRVILLFYLTPVWGTLLGWAVLRERLSLRRLLALLLGITGLFVVLGIGDQLPWPRNGGDWMALAAGAAWAYGSLRLYQMQEVAVADQVIAFVGGSILVSIAAAVVGGAVFGGWPAPRALMVAFWPAVLVSIFVLPMLFLTIWPATRLTPGRVGLLLMSEVVVGVFSAAAFSGEPFGWRELIGTVLIVIAGLVEVLGRGVSAPRE